MKKVLLTVLMVLAVLAMLAVLIGIPVLAWLRWRWTGLIIALALYTLVSMRVTVDFAAGLGGGPKAKGIACAVKAAAAALCLWSVRAHAVSPDAFRGGMPQSTTADAEDFILLIFFAEAVWVILRAVCKKALFPLLERWGLDIF